MKKIFGLNEEEMNKAKAIYTATEINQQPVTWQKTCELIKNKKEEIKSFIEGIIQEKDYDVILTGAGTSEFIGNALYSYLNKKLNYKVKSYGTTDLVASPENYLSKDKPTLLISFGRSGDSPESIGAVDVAEEVCSNIRQLFITCNKNGALAKRVLNDDSCYAINLPEETHDQSFAMTSSYSNMYLAAYLIFNLDNLEKISAEFQDIIKGTERCLDKGYELIKGITQEYNYKRIVYLGSNTLKGTAQEAALKMLELTAGEIVTMFDSPLGFRHGPKSIINDETLTVVFISDNSFTRQYEIDLVKEMSSQRKKNKILAICGQESNEIREIVDYYYLFNNEKAHDNVLLGLEFIVVAQILALNKSLTLGKTPDNPCPTGEVNRVVKGVTLYQYQVD